jgi:hypothetical protein
VTLLQCSTRLLWSLEIFIRNKQTARQECGSSPLFGNIHSSGQKPASHDRLGDSEVTLTYHDLFLSHTGIALRPRCDKKIGEEESCFDSKI